MAAADKGAVNACLHSQGYLNAIVYQPAHRFWLFQGVESALFLGLAAGLLAVTIYWVQRRAG